jgi:hypothetical protein
MVPMGTALIGRGEVQLVGFAPLDSLAQPLLIVIKDWWY